MLRIEKRTTRFPQISPALWARSAEALSLLLVSASPFGLPAPFAASLYAAARLSKRPRTALLIGTLLHFLVTGGVPYALLGCLLVEAALLLIERFARPARLATPIRAALLGAAGALLPPLLFHLGDARRAGLALGASLVSMALAPVFLQGARVTSLRTRLLPEERLALCAIAVSCVLGAGTLHPMAGYALAAGLTALAAALSPALGASVGALLGGASAALLLEPGYAASLCLTGAIAGLGCQKGRLPGVLLFALCGTMPALFIPAPAPWPLAVPTLVAWPILLCTPARRARLAAFCLPNASVEAPTPMADRLQADAAKRILSLSQIFDELSEGYRDDYFPQEEQALIGQMRQRLCAHCPGYAACWNGENPKAYRLFCALIGDAMAGRPLEESGALPPARGKDCRRAMDMPARLGPMLSQFDGARRAAMRRRSAGALLARHFEQAATVLRQASDEALRPFHPDPALAERCEAALERAQMPLRAALALKGESLELLLTLQSGSWTQETRAVAAKHLSEALGLPIRPMSSAAQPEDPAQARFAQAPELTALFGYAARAKTEQAPCGDSHLASGLSGGRVLLALSDGMGNGERAARESSGALRLIRRFMLAGIPETLMLDTVNQLLALREGQDMYATADLCVLDLAAAKASFLKLGACASYVIRRGTLLRVEGGRLPLGILDKVSAGHAETALKPGDLIVLFTDGVADSASPQETEWIEEWLRALWKLPPDQLCAALLRDATARDGKTRDDMTALAARIALSA